MYVLAWRTVYALTRGLFCCLFPGLRSNEGHKHQHNTPVRAETVHQESTYIILFLTRYNESINDVRTRIFTHHPRTSLALCTFCWWRHNRLAMTSQWPDKCNRKTWQVISNSLDIDFFTAIFTAGCVRIKISGASIRKFYEMVWLTSVDQRTE